MIDAAFVSELEGYGIRKDVGKFLDFSSYIW